MNQDLSLADFLGDRNYLGLKMEKNVAGHFEIDGFINGECARLLIDTGASTTVIDKGSSTKFSLQATSSDSKAGGVGTSQHDVEVSTVESLELGSLLISELRVVVMDLSHINQSLVSHGGNQIDGVIGGDLMTTKCAIIDYPNTILYLQRD